MKKLLLLLAAFSTLAASSQSKELDILTKRLEKSQASIADPKKSTSASTWLSHAEVMLSISNAYTSKLVAGLSIEQTQVMIGDADEVTDIVIADKPYKKYSYEDFDVFVNENHEVSFWNSKKEMKPGALDEAFAALQKAYELNPTEVESKGYLPCSNLLNQFNTDGMNLYNMKKNLEAAKMFERSVETSRMMGNVDSTMIYYTGVAYNEAEEYEKSLEFMKKAQEIGYDQDGGVVFYIAYTYEKMGKKDEAVKVLEEGLEKYPTNQMIINQLLNLYIETKKSPEVIIGMLEKAKAGDPTNSALYTTEGTLWEQLGQSDKASAAFAKSIEIDPNNFMSYYNIGVLQARKGDAKVEAANKLDYNDTKGYNALIAEAIPFYSKAIEMLEQAHKLNPKDANSIDLLKSLYFPRRDDSPEAGARFKYFDELVKAM